MALSTHCGHCGAREPDIQLRSTGCFRLLNHLGRAQQQRVRNREAERLGSLQVDDQAHPRYLLDRLLHHAETVLIEGKSFRMKDQIEP